MGKKVDDLNAGKKYMADLIEQATTAFAQREEWCSKLEALKKRAQNDFIAHSEEMREIQRQLDHDLTLREFLSVKGQKRILKDLEEKERKQRELEIEEMENQVRIYDQTLDQIKGFCEEEDTQRIASQYVKQEEENFALFNYINELNHEIETLTVTITDLQEKIDEQIEMSHARDQERKATLESMENELEESNRQVKEDENNVKNAENTLNQVLEGIADIFNLLSCDKGPVLELLGEHFSITLLNVNIYLGTIEKELSALITRVYFVEKAYTILERSSGEGGADVGGKLAKQRRVLNIFKKERKNLQIDLGVATSDGKMRGGRQTVQATTRTPGGIRRVRRGNQDEEGALQGDRRSDQNRQQKGCNVVLELGAQIITDHKYLDRTLKGEKTLQTLENKLEVQTRKFCTVCSENVKLREEINHLLIERFEFNKIWDRLINNLNIGKKVHDGSDRTGDHSVRSQGRVDIQVAVAQGQGLPRFTHTSSGNTIYREMRRLQRKHDDNMKLKDFFRIKGQKRIMRDLEEKEMKRRQINRANMQERLTTYLDLMINIKDFTGQTMVHDIARNFLEQEEENFAKFKYVNHLNEEMEELSDVLGHLQVEIDEQHALHEMYAKQQADTIQELEAKYDKAKKSADSKEGEFTVVDNKLQSIIVGVGKLFAMFKCNNDPLIQLLGRNENIHYYNIELYMEILENNIQRALIGVFRREKALLEKRKMKPDQLTIREVKGPLVTETIERIVSTNPCPLCVEHEMVSDVIDELQFAYDKETIQKRLAARLKLEGAAELNHNVSACHLPKSREIIQKKISIKDSVTRKIV
ncbi:hypothetical protein NQ317_002138 [Molorchus minor]|uniref:ODAD1 central coiled coil region domain-containing protein n=1 Tax=Molorchus minor TaxID=1323400 RepID=A0ABQ9JV61_9CUCU|nr:hypothetical protein NQ317_002138 [Molorchus minor]